MKMKYIIVRKGMILTDRTGNPVTYSKRSSAEKEAEMLNEYYGLGLKVTDDRFIDTGKRYRPVKPVGKFYALSSIGVAPVGDFLVAE